MSPAPETKSPGVAEVSAFACVVSTAVIHNGAVSPLASPRGRLSLSAAISQAPEPASPP
jgi:hypothetical protein